MNYLIYTDFNDILINHEKYSHNDILKAIRVLKEKNVSLMLTTKHTKHETLHVKETFDLDSPFIVEDGASIFFPKDYKKFDLSTYPLEENFRVLSLGKRYAFIEKYLETIQNKYNLTTFSSMNLEELQQLTNLDKHHASMLQKRDFSEFFVMEDNDLAPILNEEASLYGLQIKKEKDFFCCRGKMQDKGKAIQTSTAIFRRNGKDVKTIEILDGKTSLNVTDIQISSKNWIKELEELFSN